MLRNRYPGCWKLGYPARDRVVYTRDVASRPSQWIPTSITRSASSAINHTPVSVTRGADDPCERRSIRWTLAPRPLSVWRGNPTPSAPDAQYWCCCCSSEGQGSPDGTRLGAGELLELEREGVGMFILSGRYAGGRGVFGLKPRRTQANNRTLPYRQPYSATGGPIRKARAAGHSAYSSW